MNLRQHAFVTGLCLVASATCLKAEDAFYPLAPAAISDAPWCAPDAPWVPNLYQPDGALIAVGTRVFRVCASAVSPHGERTMRLLFNPRKVDGLRYDVSISTLTLSDLAKSEKWLEIMLRSQIRVGTRAFGGVTYQEYDYSELKGEDRLFSSLFIYDPALNHTTTELPPHAITCGDKNKRPNRGKTCFVFVFYKDMRANSMFIGDAPGLAPIPREKFPEIAQDMWRALATADVTDQLDEFQNQLPMLD